ncbi:hypothetical protein [Methylomonas rhizoryzae]|uniref:hypothetical protein n=1 Tax=Methylomonas rhizoryzae TaxID=2608981 RepID=UPI001231BFD2|nr:hypothetical protein [Methylomonas rhizoryzae]
MMPCNDSIKNRRWVAGPDNQINALEKKRLVLNDQLVAAKQPLPGFDEMYRIALHLLVNPLKI